MTADENATLDQFGEQWSGDGYNHGLSDFEADDDDDVSTPPESDQTATETTPTPPSTPAGLTPAVRRVDDTPEQCEATTADGERCSLRAADGSHYCHLPAHSDDSDD